MTKFKKIFIPFIIISSLLLIGCNTSSKNKNETTFQSPVSRTEFFMGTVVKISLYNGDNTKALEEAFARVKEIEDLVSINKTDTELDKVNAAAGKEAVKVSDTTFDIVEKGLKYSEMSDGAFDITVGPLVKLWSIGLPGQKLPTQEEINETLPLVNYNNLELNKDEHTIFLKEEGMVIDLGAIAKGYAADEVTNILKANDVKSAIVDLGGNLYTLGVKPSGDEWNIGIQVPDANISRGEIIGSIQVSNTSIVTSGTYERFFEENGVRYHHIIDPKTGYPYKNNIEGITIVTDKSIDADALSTTIFAKGLDDGLAFIDSLDYVEAIFVTAENKVYVTEGLRDSFKITNDAFEIVNY